MKFRFRRIVKQYQDRMYSLAVHMLGDAAAAEDVVQEVMIKLWRHLPKLEVARVKPWLLRVTRNACIDVCRRRQHQQAYALAVGSDNQVATTTPLRSLEVSELGDRLNQAIQALSEPFRSLIVLREIQACSYREIAEALELSEAQVKVYLHRARRKLRLALTSTDPDEQ